MDNQIADQEDLVSMADISRLAGESRSTVGNWKLRSPAEFPAERGQSQRGPLYSRAEVTAWLQSKGKLAHRSAPAETLWKLTDSLRSQVRAEEAMLLLLVLLAIRVADDALWSQLKAEDGDVDSSMRSIADDVIHGASRLLPRETLPTHLLRQLIHTIDVLDSLTAPKVADEIVSQATAAMGRSGGEYVTPRCVRLLVADLAGTGSVVYNPGCGAGQLIVEMKARHPNGGVQIYAQEISEWTATVARINLLINGVVADVAVGDVFGDNRFPDLRADCIVSVPPWGTHLDENLLRDPRWIWGELGQRDGNAAWIQHCLAHLAKDGRAVMVFPSVVLFEQGRVGRIRERIINAGLLETVVRLPARLFRNTGLVTNVLVFRKGRGTSGGRPQDTLMVDLSDAATTSPRSIADLSDDTVRSVAALRNEWLEGRFTSTASARSVTFDEIASNDYIVDPVRYLAAPRVDIVPADIARRKAELVSTLGSLLRDAERTDQRILALLNGERTGGRQ